MDCEYSQLAFSLTHFLTGMKLKHVDTGDILVLK